MARIFRQLAVCDWECDRLDSRWDNSGAKLRLGLYQTRMASAIEMTGWSPA
jgi:hypothetical protein